ncbi:MAG: hypothetical protein HW407_2299, partial [Bacteroidetes bacterium]|nr:hypothetical protein [Bacteroidota bacterium]
MMARELDGHVYELTFTNQSAFQNNPNPTFRFTDETTGQILVDDLPVIATGEETPIVNGMIGYIYNDTSVAIVEEGTQWTTGEPNTITTVDLDPSPGFTLVNVRYPADFEIRFSDQVVDTSTTGLFFGAPTAKPTNFTVWNLTEDAKSQFLFYDPDGDGQYSVGDRIIIVYGDSLGKSAISGGYRTTWTVQMFLDTLAGNLVLPGPGDVFSIVTTKPFRSGEAFQFAMRAPAVNAVQAKSDLDKVAVVPNPYVGAASWEPPNLFQSGRGERRIFFINLPARCTIRIFTVRGYLV